MERGRDRPSRSTEQATYRDLGKPLLRHIGRSPPTRSTVAIVDAGDHLPRLARALHNQCALYIKRLLLFERHVILSSVPYQLFR